MTNRASKLIRALRNRPVLTSSAALALGLVLGHSQPAFAQDGFQGTGQITFGEGDIQQDPGGDIISVFGEQTVIDWTPNDTDVNGADLDFLPDGTSAFFQGDGSLANFTILNRIIANDPSRAIILNGDIVSQFINGPVGGSVWFYAPGGVVIGSTATIDVGGLFLTASDPVVDGEGNFINGGTTVFQQAQFTTARAAIEAGASVNLTPENSYIGMFAPNIQQSGNVTVNGSAAYIAAEAGSITFNQGLFDINVTIGTDADASPNDIAIQHDGTTTGPASSGTGDFHRIYMVAIPKNTAITMAIENSGDLGFDVAGAAEVDGNTVILSAGYNVTGNLINDDPVNGIAANISISGVDITSNLVAQGSGAVSVSTFAGDVNAASNVQLQGDTNAALISNVNGNAINIAGDLMLTADDFATGLGADGIAGVLNVDAINGGNIFVGGNATFSASGQGGDNFTGAGAVGRGQGGDIFFNIQNGSAVNIGNNLLVNSAGFAGFGSFGTSSASGTGGQFFLNMTGAASTLDVGGNFAIDVSGFGSEDFDGSGDNTGDGGTVSLSLADDAHAINVANDFIIQANGLGGNTFDGNVGGFGQGGNILASFFDGSALDVGNNMQLEAIGSGGSLQGSFGAIDTGGGADGGEIILQFANNAIADIAGNLALNASALGGFTGINRQGVDTGIGGDALGGIASLTIQGGANLTVVGTTNLDTSANGGASSTAGNGAGGTATIDANNGGIANFNDELIVNASGFGGGNDTGTGRTGNGQGGTAAIVATSGGFINALNDVTLTAEGAAGIPTTDGADGGDGFGGNVSISQDSQGIINVAANAILNASGTGAANLGGGDNIAGNGTGGDARIAVNSAGAMPGDISIFIGGEAIINATGTGGDASNGGIRGGDGLGGLGNLGAANGRLVVQGASTINTNGVGGSALTGGNGGNGTGGQSLVGTVSTGALIELGGTLTASAVGNGGQGFGAGNIGGNGQGGTAQIFADSGSVDITALVTLDASGNGGFGTSGANGGDGLGATSSLTSNGDGTITIGETLTMIADATGGGSETGNGGDATGGNAELIVNAATAAIIVNGEASLRAEAMAMDAGGNGGNAAAGSINVILNDGGSINLGNVVNFNADAVGGNSLIDGNGGNADAGSISIIAAGPSSGAISTGALIATANATGGAGADSTVGNGGNGGSVTGGSLSILFGTADVLSTIDIDNIDLTMVNIAGRGGNSLAEANGGDGGDVTGGSAVIAGQAARGALTVNNVELTLTSVAGNGGNGDNNGNGGNGGSVVAGGLYQLGTISGGVTGQTLGSASFGDILVNSTVTGGNGGNGGVDAMGAIAGNGGLGGSAMGDSIIFISRGSPAIFGNITASTEALGGNGGMGNVEGNGGDAAGGDLTFLITNRLDLPNRGNVTAGDVLFTNIAVAGDGNIAGQSISGTASIQLTQSDALINSFTANVTGGFVDPVTNPSAIFAEDSTLNITNDLILNTEGYLAIFTQNILNTDTAINVNGNLDLSASTFVSDLTNTGTFPGNAGTLNVLGNASFTSPQDVILSTNLNAANDVNIDVAGDAFLLDVTSGGAITITTDIGDIMTGILDAVTDVDLATNIGFINTGNVSAGNSITMMAGNGDIITGALDTAISLNLTAIGGSVSAGNIAAADSVIVNADNGIALGNVAANNILQLSSANGALSAGDVSSDEVLDLQADGNIIVNRVSGGDTITQIISTSGNVRTNRIIGGTGNIIIDAAQSVQTELIDTAGSVVINSGGNVLLQVIEANGGVTINAETDLTTGRISTSGVVNAGDDFGLSLSAGNDILTGSLSSDERIGLLSRDGTITTGNITTTSDLLILSVGDIITGRLSAGTMDGNFIYLGNSAIAAGGAALDPDTIFANAPTATQGDIAINGTVTGGNLLAAAMGSILFTDAVTLSTSLQVDVGGVASFDGITLAPDMAIRSGNIAIGTAGALGDENSNSINLVSTNAEGTIIGDSMTAIGGYLLDADEASRIRAVNIAISAEGAGGITIGDLTLTGGNAMNSNLVGANGSLSITGTDNVRISGIVNITDMALTNELLIAAPLIEIATDTGSIILESNSLGGSLVLTGDNIHIGSTALLEQLSADPFFAGRDDELAQPTPGLNPDGTIQASAITFNASETLLIQNSGDTDVIGGFFVETGGLTINPTGTAGQLLDLVIHGVTINADDSLVINDDVRDTIFSSAPSGFTEASSINGCALTAASCTIADPGSGQIPEPDPAPDSGLPDGGASDGGEEDVIAAGVRDTQQENSEQDTAEQEEPLSQDEEPLTEEETVTEEDEEKAEEKATAKSPINRPVSIINTRALTNSGPIEEPVTSGGNPNLMGAPVSSGSVSGGDEQGVGGAQ